MNYVNLILLMINFMSFVFLSFIYLYFTRQYYIYRVPRINTYNDVISGKQIEAIITRLKIIYNLQDYEIVYNSTHKYIKLFKNLQKNKKITISKRIFESVGYEIDYIASRIWISQKKLNKHKDIVLYKITLVYLPIIILIVMIIVFIFNLFIFIYMFGDFEQATYKSEVLFWFWKYPIISFIFILLVCLLSLNYFWSTKLKEKLEKKYTAEMSKIIYESFDEFKIDFEAARTYSESIKLSLLPIYKPQDFWQNSKWLGTFVYF